MDAQVLFDVMLLNTDEEGFTKVDTGAMIIINDELQPVAVFSSNLLPRECKGSQKFKAALTQLKTAGERIALILHPEDENKEVN